MYSDWESIFSQLEDHEAGILIKHFFSYVNDKNPVLEDRLLKMAFEPMKLQLKRDLIKWEETKKKRAEAGRKGGVKSGEVRSVEANEANASHDDVSQANEADNVNGSVTVNGTVSDIGINKESSLGASSSPKKSATQHLKDTLESRKAAFRKTLIPFTITPSNPNGRFDGDMVKRFFEYWKEPNKSKTKMKFELEKTWDVESRLNYWENNGFDKKKNNGFLVSEKYHTPHSNKIDHSNLEI